MAKVRGVEAKLKRLRELRHDYAAPEVSAELRSALGDQSSLVASAAAEIVGARLLAELAPDLVAAFERFMIEPEESDKQCRAKTAIVVALNQLEYEREEVFRLGVRHVQGYPMDTAVHLRANAAFALTRIRVPDLLSLLVDLLVDRESIVRRAAAQALGASGFAAAVPLLRFKTRCGDADPAVIGECLSALMSLAPAESLPFLAEYLHGHAEAVQEGAAFALGESRRPDALQLLLDYWPRARGGALQDVILLAVAMTRLPKALDFLIGLIAAEPQAIALATVAALRIHRHHDAIKARVAAAVSAKKDPVLAARFKQKFDAEG